MKDKILRLNLYFGLGCLAFSGISLALQFPLMKTWFFCFAWWSLILVLDSLNFRRLKTSPLAQSFGKFLLAAFFSVFVWTIFELFNLRLKNWTYHGLPRYGPERWLGYFLGFATVIPALQELSMFFQGLFKKRRISLFRIRVTPVFLKASAALGFLSIFLILSWPRLFFPLTWLCFILLLEPLNYSRQSISFLKDLERSDVSRLAFWLLAGLGSGFLWEFWNFWSGSHWEYHLPYFNSWRVFHMPIFGYLGFLPFSLEAFAFNELFFSLYRKIKNKPLVMAAACVLIISFYGLCFYLIDALTWIH